LSQHKEHTVDQRYAGGCCTCKAPEDSFPARNLSADDDTSLPTTHREGRVEDSERERERQVNVEVSAECDGLIDLV